MDDQRPSNARGVSNVLVDLELPGAVDLTAKAELAKQINDAIDERGLTQVLAAKVLRMPQPKVSAIRNYKLDGISLERLMRASASLGSSVVISSSSSPLLRNARKRSVSHRKPVALVLPAYADSFELYPRAGRTFQLLHPLLSRVPSVRFAASIANPRANQGQIETTFDSELESTLRTLGAGPAHLSFPANVRSHLDFDFVYQGRKVAVEVEKSNREKVLRDILKCHIYLKHGADLTLIALPKNFPHAHGEWNLFDFGCQLYDQCKRYGMGSQTTLGKILLLGFKQYDEATGKPWSKSWRKAIRERTLAGE